MTDLLSILNGKGTALAAVVVSAAFTIWYTGITSQDDKILHEIRVIKKEVQKTSVTLEGVRVKVDEQGNSIDDIRSRLK